MNKDELRKVMLKKREGILDKERKSNNITNKIINLNIYQKAKVIALYKSMNNEVNTSRLINISLESKKVLLPKIIDNKMVFIEVNENTKYFKSSFGVMEPIGKIYYGNIDLIIVPGVSFDEENNRLGFGMGYYDKYLSNKDIYKIGICFDKQIVDVLPCELHDVKMDLVITENKVYKKDF